MYQISCLRAPGDGPFKIKLTVQYIYSQKSGLGIQSLFTLDNFDSYKVTDASCKVEGFIPSLAILSLTSPS